MKLLDTTFLIDLLRGKNGKGLQNVTDLDLTGPHCTTSINVHELLVGAHGSSKPEKELKVRKELIKKLIILNYDIECAEISAKIEADQRSKGDFIGGADILIASVMIKNGIKEIITRNYKHFSKIPNISIIKY
jgi:predicted nucleic acid-binding protein